MARYAFACGVSNGRPFGAHPTTTTAPAVSSLNEDQAVVAAAMATLVADGASPTEAHVTSLSAAWAVLTATIDTFLADNPGVPEAVDLVAAQAAFDATVAVLVADGATPTEAHVTDADDAWGPLSDLIDDAIVSANSVVVSDVFVTFDSDAVVTLSVLRQAFAAIALSIEGSDRLTP